MAITDQEQSSRSLLSRFFIRARSVLLRWVFPPLAILLLIILGKVASVQFPMSPVTGNYLNDDDRHTEARKSTIVVGTYNIRSGKGLDGVRSIERIGEVLNAVSMDVIGLNEVSGSLLQPAGQAKQLADMLDSGWLFAPTREKLFSADFGNAFLSRLRIIDYSVIPLASENRTRSGTQISRAPRNFVKAVVQINDIRATVLITHLDRGPLRLAQLAAIIDEFRKYSPAILMGDLNSTRTDQPLHDILEQQEATDAVGMFVSDEELNNRVDWILTRGFRVVSSGYTPPGASDHPQVWAEIEPYKE